MEFLQNNLYILFLLSLVTLRISLLLVLEEGMFLIFERMRMFFGVYYVSPVIQNNEQKFVEIENRKILNKLKNNEHINYIKMYKNEFSKLFSCVWCMSVWVSFVVNLIWFLTYGIPLDLNFIFTTLATSSLAILLNRIL